MENTIRLFTEQSLFNACEMLMKSLSIGISKQTERPLSATSVFKGVQTKALDDALQYIQDIYYIGSITDSSLAKQESTASADEEAEKSEEQRYKTMVVFAMDVINGKKLNRGNIASLTRSLNRRYKAMPIILIVREKTEKGCFMSLATCERGEYTQAWRQGEKLGKVAILHDVNCNHLHRGHKDILEGLQASECKTFDKLYEKWMKVFNSEVLTKKFYDDLFEWYQWAVKPETKVSFPGNADTQNDDREDIDTRVIRLITRLMFVWFIKQKELVPNEIFDVDYVKSILIDSFDPQSTTGTEYYQAILQNLFFGTLNRAILEDGETRGFATNNGKELTNLYRYGKSDKDGGLFSISDEDVVTLFSKVPYLNCGLFDCQDKTKTFDGVSRRYYNDGFSRNPAKFADGTYKYRAVVPNVLFFHPEKGLLSIFKRYVFTIEENTPQDVQVALDPELLGKVFENLLGAYNPETKETARNQSGSFYTPREIVQYMVNESLVAHLKRTVGEELEAKYRELLDFSTENVELTDKQKKDILHSLFTCKILDPACGSGAFPMGMLQQMVHILQQVDPDNSQWREVLLNLAVDESRRAFGINDEQERKKKLQEIEETFNNGLNSPDYTRKLYIIESCIYGVDIQPIAMLITRLRFFITLICEQRDIKRDKPEENFGIKTLPNLESKFVAANSLIDADIHKYNEDWTQNEELAILKDELMAIRRRHFYTRKRNEKTKLLREDEKKRDQIHTLINKLVGEPNQEHIAELEQTIKDCEALLPKYQEPKWVEESIQQNLFDPPTIIKVDANKRQRDRINAQIAGCKRDIEHELNKCTPTGFEAAVLQVTDWNPYDQNSVSPFLDMEWMFGIVDGFDIVIGNPPYIQLQADKGKLAKLYEPCGYQSFLNGGDIYCLFYERANQILKTDAILCFITSNKWMRAGYGEKLRKYLTSNTTPELLIDFGETHVFESACVMTNVLLFSKQNSGKETTSTQIELDFKDPSSLHNYVAAHSINCKFEGDESWVIMSSDKKRIKTKVENIGKVLQSWNISINYGIKTGYNPAFFITDDTRTQIINSCKDDKEKKLVLSLIRPLLRGKDILKYGNNWNNTKLWIINTHNGIKNKLAPIDIDDIPSIKNHLDNYFGRLSKRADKGITPYNLRNCAYLNDFDKPKIMYPNMTKYLPFYYDEMKFLQNDKSFFIVGEHISYLTAFLNSSLFKYCFMDNFPPLFGGSRELRKIFFDKIPVLEVDDATDNEFRELVLDIQNEYSDEKAKIIDQKIFDLYGLTQEERDMIGYIDYHNNGEEDNDE